MAENPLVISWNLFQGGTDRAVQSPEYKEIYSAVIDTYMNNAVLRFYKIIVSVIMIFVIIIVIIVNVITRTFADDAHMLQTAHIINIVNIFDKEYSTAQIYWVLPYQVNTIIRIGSINILQIQNANTGYKYRKQTQDTLQVQDTLQIQDTNT